MFYIKTLTHKNNKPPWHAWIKNSFGRPASSWQCSPSNNVSSRSISTTLPSVPQTNPLSPWLRMHRIKTLLLLFFVVSFEQMDTMSWNVNKAQIWCKYSQDIQQSQCTLCPVESTCAWKYISNLNKVTHTGKKKKKKKKKISHRHWGPLRGSSYPFLALWAGEG